MNSNREFRRHGQFWILIPIMFFGLILSIFSIAYFLRPFPIGIYPPFYYFPWWIIFPLFFFGLFFFGFRWCGCGYRWGSRGYYVHDTTLEVLRERFARGETTKEQYDQMRRDLEASSQ
ncbi:MAG: SHOCT domain-containing protein [Nitrososphaerota archaeon]|nr:SHOCT domain-containing protein [Nitrososphaerota archaeon]